MLVAEFLISTRLAWAERILTSANLRTFNWADRKDRLFLWGAVKIQSLIPEKFNCMHHQLKTRNRLLSQRIWGLTGKYGFSFNVNRRSWIYYLDHAQQFAIVWWSSELFSLGACLLRSEWRASSLQPRREFTCLPINDSSRRRGTRCRGGVGTGIY